MKEKHCSNACDPREGAPRTHITLARGREGPEAAGSVGLALQKERRKRRIGQQHHDRAKKQRRRAIRPLNQVPIMVPAAQAQGRLAKLRVWWSHQSVTPAHTRTHQLCHVTQKYISTYVWKHGRQAWNVHTQCQQHCAGKPRPRTGLPAAPRRSYASPPQTQPLRQSQPWPRAH